MASSNAAADAFDRKVLDRVSDLFGAYDRDFRVVFLNKASRELLRAHGVAPERLLGRRVFDVFPETAGSEIERAFKRAMAGCKPIRLDYHFRQFDRWLELNIYPSRGGLTVYGRDVTARRERLEKLRRESDLRRAIERSIPAGIAIVDLEGRQSYVNPAFCRLVGYSEKELVGRKAPYPYWPRDERARIEEAFRKTLAGRAPQGGFELRFRRKDGRLIDVHVSLSPLLADGGRRPSGWLGAVSDITERKQAQAELAELLRKLEIESQRVRAIVSNVPGIVWEAWGSPDAGDQRITFVSDYAEKLLGYKVDEWLSNPNFWLQIVHPEDRSLAAQRAAAGFAAGDHGANQFRWVAKDGRVVWVEAQAVVVKDEAGRPVGMRGVTMDITARKLAEEALKRNEAAQREFVANVSHDFRTPVAAIMGFAETLLRGGLADDRHRRSFVETIHRNARRLEALVNDLLMLATLDSGRLALRPESLELRPLVAEKLEEFRPLIGRRRLSVSLDIPRALRVHADCDQLHKILQNLLSNAIKYNRPGGRILVSARPLGAGQVRVSVKDTGVGIAKEHHARIFERFYRVQKTRDRMPGDTGLGLHICKQLVELMGQRIWAESRPGRGSTFHFTLARRSRRRRRAR